MGTDTMRLASRILFALASAFLLATAGCQTAPPEPATLLLLGRTYPIEESAPSARAEGVAVRGDRIAAVGTRDEILRYRGEETKVIELDEKQTILPGFIESHGHIFNLGLLHATLDLTDVRSYEELVARAKERAALAPKDAWILGRGWDQNLWPEKSFPAHDALSKALGGHPAWLIRVDGHAGLANKRALDAAGITAKTKDIAGGRIERKKGSREPSGILVDKAMGLIERARPQLQSEQVLSITKDAMLRCAAAGLTTVHDAGASKIAIEIYYHLGKEGHLPIRIYAMRDGRKDPLDAMDAPPIFNLFGGYLNVRAVKFQLDGALGSRGAALLAPYADEAENSGLMQMTLENFKGACREAFMKGYQVATHCIGDAANRLALDVYEEVFRESGRDPRDFRWRIEHAQILAPADIARFARLNIIPAMQFIHATSDMKWAEERVGAGRLAGAYAWRKFRNAGCRIAGGSDFPVESENPFYGIYAAMTRQDAGGNPEGGWLPGERLTREEAFLAYTRWAAFAEFAEESKGVLRPGAYADLIVVDRDVFAVPALDLRETRVLHTLVGGRSIVQPKEKPASQQGK